MLHTVLLFSRLLKDSWVVSRLWFLQIKLMCVFTYRFSYEPKVLVFLGEIPRSAIAELYVSLSLMAKKRPDSFPDGCAFSPTSVCAGSGCLVPLSALGTDSSFFLFFKPFQQVSSAI